MQVIGVEISDATQIMLDEGVVKHGAHLADAFFVDEMLEVGDW